MTTKPSSSLRDPLNSSASLTDSTGAVWRIGREIGKGGEGRVYELDGHRALLAKVYHQTPLDRRRVEKLEALIALWSDELEKISAWPRSLLCDPASRRPCGILIPKVADAHQLHELYGATNRRRHFPEVAWHHLVLAARNTAAAFYRVHSTGVVIGDVNQSNLLVDKQMCVRLIDCDSVQVAANGKSYACPVGSPHFTPPELQSMRLRDVVRTEDHDRFGLAVLIFHLLFVGRHPFAGRYRGPGDLPIEKAIAERRFAFSKHRQETLVEPPPASLALEDLPRQIAELFEAAFRHEQSASGARPSPGDWVEQLEALMKQRQGCQFDPMHVYYRHNQRCPWCRIEEAGGPAFFVQSGGVSIVSDDRFAMLDQQIRNLQETEFPDFPTNRLVMPRVASLKALKDRPRWSLLDAAAASLAASWTLCLVGMLWTPALAAGAALSIAGGGYLLVSQQGKQRRQKAGEFRAWLAKSQDKLARTAQSITARYRQRAASFRKSAQSFNAELEHYRAEGDQLRDVLVQYRYDQKNAFLRQSLIRDHAANIPGLSNSAIVMLESYGVESAYDVDNLKLMGIPAVTPDLNLELLQWRSQIEKGFVYKPEHGVSPAELEAAGEQAARRFKTAQARKILMGEVQLQTLADAGKAALNRELRNYDGQAEKWRAVAKQLRYLESRRHRLERSLNQSTALLAAITFGGPAVAWIGWMLFH